MSRPKAAPVADVEVVLRGDVPPGARDHAHRMVNDLARYSPDPILHARVRVTAAADPAQERPVITQANVDVNGRLVRAQVAARSADEGIDLLFDVLKQRLFDDLDLMDYQFQLFTDLDTGQDSVVYRAGETGYRMAQLRPDPRRSWTTAVPMTISGQPAPRLGLPEAIERLNLTALPFLFFADVDSGRGRVLYRRYDGHYGLITPAS
jgi:hypothetical protein